MVNLSQKFSSNRTAAHQNSGASVALIRKRAPRLRRSLYIPATLLPTWTHSMMRHRLLTIALLPALWAATALAADLEPQLGAKGLLLLEENFDADSLPKGWAIKNGKVRVAEGALRASQDKEAGRLCLFNCQQPMQDAAIQIDFKFDGARGINISAN